LVDGGKTINMAGWKFCAFNHDLRQLASVPSQTDVNCGGDPCLSCHEPNISQLDHSWTTVDANNLQEWYGMTACFL